TTVQVHKAKRSTRNCIRTQNLRRCRGRNTQEKSSRLNSKRRKEPEICSSRSSSARRKQQALLNMACMLVALTSLKIFCRISKGLVVREMSFRYTSYYMIRCARGRDGQKPGFTGRGGRVQF